jgi:hypothetical protein
MSPQTESVLPELELNKETLQDLGVEAIDAAQVKGGYGEVRMTIGSSGTSVIQPGTQVQTGTSIIRQNPSGG